MEGLGKLLAEAVIGIDTLWGGDVLCASGTGRFIADSWFSDEPLPPAYTIPAAARIRETGGVTGKQPDRTAIDEYLKQIDIWGAANKIRQQGEKIRGLRGAYLTGLAGCIEVMWDLAMEVLAKGAPVSYEKCVKASTGRAPEPSKPEKKRDRVEELLQRTGYTTSGEGGVLKAVDAWRADRLVPMASVRALGNAVIAHYDKLCEKNLAPYLPKEFADVPRANIEFLPIKDAWFSGSMNYLGRTRTADGRPNYEATYEINASLKMSVPEFEQLVSHEVVPGHVTTFAYLQNLYVRGMAGFEATVLTMNTRAATLFEGIANNAILMAHGVTEVDQLPDEDLQIGVSLALLQDDAKNQSSYLTWKEHAPQQEVARTLRRDFLVTEERADKLSGAWGRHPLLGRMYLPAYRSGTERIAELRRKHPAAKVLPALYGCSGLVDIETVAEAIIAGCAARSAS
ncbi:MAG TPA: hypothetical protein VMU53_17995 [Candidatus Sulfotelmatobacter sp.]|nr:hypothetical protein [Candidatus Sulfotelmatobacter sp.]